ncbi:MAG TPA: N-acyl homoserine lactonase family protein [Candidatus Dormibacteraeota bacterium]
MIDVPNEFAPRVVALRYGTLPATRSAFFLRYEDYGEPDGPQSLDYYLWVVGEGSGALVVDTGFDPAVAARRGRECLCAPREALRRLGVDPGAVSRLLLTHLHYDHVGNLDAFPNAELLVPERELDFWTGPLAARGQFAQHVEPAEIARLAAAHREGRVRTIAGRTEVADGVTAIEVGGHSPGQHVVLVEAGGGPPVALASDAVHLYEELERDRPFSIVADVAAMYRAYDLLRALAAERGAVIVPGHDPEVTARFPRLDGPAADVAVRIA